MVLHAVHAHVLYQQTTFSFFSSLIVSPELLFLALNADYSGIKVQPGLS